MKQTIIHILSIVLLIMAFPFDSSGKDKVIDFNFPQDVFKAAIADLDQAFEAVWNLVTDICCCGFHLHCNGYKDSAELRAKQEQAVLHQ